MTEITPTTPATEPKPRPPFSPQQARQIGQGIINLALIIWTVRDIRRRSDAEIKGNRKLWLLAAFAPPIGPVAYFIFGRKRNSSASRSANLS